MPLNGSGSYSAPASTWNPAVDGTTINSTDWAALLADITTALSTAIYKDGQQTTTALVNFALGASVPDSAFYVKDNLDATKIAQFQCSGITTGTTRVYTFVDSNMTFARIDASQTFTGAQTWNANANSNAYTFTNSDNNGNFSMVLTANGATANNQYGHRMVLASDPNNTTNFFFQGIGNATARAYIYSSGTFGSATNTYGAIVSERRFKDNIVKAGSQLSDVKFLAAAMSKFSMKDDPSKAIQLGWIIDEIEDTCPGLIMESTDKDSGDVRKGLKTSVALMKGFKATGELIEQIEFLTGRIDAMQKEIDSLKTA